MVSELQSPGEVTVREREGKNRGDEGYMESDLGRGVDGSGCIG